MAEAHRESSEPLQVDLLRVYAPPVAPAECRLWRAVVERAEKDLQSDDPTLRDEAREWLTSDRGIYALIRGLAPEPKARRILQACATP